MRAPIFHSALSGASVVNYSNEKIMKVKMIFLSALSVFVLHGCGSSTTEPVEESFSLEHSVSAAELVSGLGSGTGKAPETGVEPVQGAALPVAGAVAELISIADLSYVGAFALPTAEDGVSTLDYSAGVIEVNGDSLLIVGHDQHDAIAEFSIPDLVASTEISALNIADAPRQSFVKILDRAASGNPESLDEIVGLEVVGNALVINAIEYYDAPADNQLSTLVVDNASDLKNSAVGEFRSMVGLTRAAGWLSAIPEGWRPLIGGSHISGFSSGAPIIGRLSVGPSAFAVDLEAVVATASTAAIPSKELLGFSLDQPLNNDLLNESGQNNLWTHLSQARFGFIVPGTRTYMTLGQSGGHQSGVGYKVSQSDGNVCGGHCSFGAQDSYNYYWLWDLDDLLSAAAGAITPDSIKPYEFGQLDLPFQTGTSLKPVGGASYDSVKNLLYISLVRANNELGEYNNPPIIVAYRINP